MNADRFKYKEITDIVLTNFQKMGRTIIIKEKISVMISVNRRLNSCLIYFKKLYKGQSGSVLLGLIVTMVVLSALAAAMIAQTTTGSLGFVNENSSLRAYYLAESGFRYAAAKLKNAGSESAKNDMLEFLHNKDYTLSGNHGRFHLDIYPYYYVANVYHPAGTTILNTKVCGGFPPDFTLTSGYLKIDGEVYPYTNAVQSDSNVTFTIPSGTLEINEDTTVYSASRPNAQQTLTDLNNVIVLENLTGSANAFPDLNGSFRIYESATKWTYWSYTKLNRETDPKHLEGVASNDTGVSLPFTIYPVNNIVLDKFIKLKSTGIVAAGSDLETRRDILYHFPIPEKTPTEKVAYHETFEDLTKWGTGADEGEIGGHAVAAIDGSKALHVTSVVTSPEGHKKSSIDFNWHSTNIDLEAIWEGASYLLSYDLQTKIKVDNDEPYYMAGISFRKESTASDTNLYGVSYLRARQVRYFKDGFTTAYFDDDSIPLGLKPTPTTILFFPENELEYGPEEDWISPDWGTQYRQFRYSKPAIILWQRTIDGYKWLAYNVLTSVDYVVYELSPPDSKKLRLKDWSNLQVRVIEAYPLDFSNGGPSTFLCGDTIIIMRGTTKIGTARVNGTPIITSDNWATNSAAGTLTLSNVQIDDVMLPIQFNDDLQINGVTRAKVAATPPDPWTKTNFIRVYYGDTSEHGTPTDPASPTDNIRWANQRVTTSGQAINWPVDNVSEWAAGNDYLTLVQWEGVNSGVDRLGGSDELNAIIQDDILITLNSGSFDRPEIALHTFGDTSTSIYFDDFAIQVEAISGSRKRPLPATQQ